MALVNTMVSSTLCCTNRPRPDAAVRRWSALVLLRRWALWCCLAFSLGLAGAGAVHAQDAGSVSDLRLERTDEGVYLSAQLLFKLPALAEDALYKGIPMYFVLEAQVARERWYWTDRKVAQAERYLRLSYQPLTRRWRLNMANEPLDRTGLGVVLGQNFDTLDEAVEALQRVARWKIADVGALAAGENYSVRLDFRLDMSQLARPFQIGALGSNGWSLALDHRARVVVEVRP